MGDLVQAFGLIQGGRSAERAAAREAEIIEAQGALVEQEAQKTAASKAIEDRKFRARQRLSFLKNGVSLEGSPLLVLQETEDVQAEQRGAIRERGRQQRLLAGEKASLLKRRGRAQLTSGLFQAGSLVEEPIAKFTAQ